MFANLFCSECIRFMPPGEFAIWLVAGLVFTGFSLLGAYRNFKRSRLVADMPTSRVRSASQGYSELVGVAVVKDSPLMAPLTYRPCLWWHYRIERYQSSGKSSHWVTLEKKSSDKPFYLNDSTGLCAINPAGAEISSLHKKVWYGASRKPPGLPDKANSSVFALSRVSFGRRYRYTEQLIVDGDPLYALGHFTTDSSGSRTINLEKLAGDILSHWKQDFPALLEKYDADGSGELEIREWRNVQKAAKKEAVRQQSANAARPAEHSLVKPDGGLPFIIGSQAQETLINKFRHKALARAAGFIMAGALTSWLISSRFIA